MVRSLLLRHLSSCLASQMPLSALHAVVDSQGEIRVDNLLLRLDKFGLLTRSVAAFTATALRGIRAGVTDFMFLRHGFSITNAKLLCLQS